MGVEGCCVTEIICGGSGFAVNSVRKHARKHFEKLEEARAALDDLGGSPRPLNWVR